MDLAYLIGLDIGGANTKVCYLRIDGGKLTGAGGNSVYYELWRNPNGLGKVLRDFPLPALVSEERPAGIALTMTGELCDCFTSKAQGVLAIFAAVADSFPRVPIYTWTVNGAFISPQELTSQPGQAAAANWLASALALAQSPSLTKAAAIFADMGSTTTDILSLASGRVLARGQTDTERLLTGELIYTGILRTSVDAVVKEVYLDGQICSVAHEYFTVMADVNRLLGQIAEADYTVATPDGGGKDRESCARRLARLVAAEAEELGEDAICRLACCIREKQLQQVMDGMLRHASRKEMTRSRYFITAGQGSFLLKTAAERLGWQETPWWKIMPGAGPDLPMAAYAVAWLLAQRLYSRLEGKEEERDVG
ncbi:hydantoinase/oxoprolinase family protein [Desulfosporosinus lacus]|uniref:hydantoinase/oxoprolinase family protein n=1 Tax=Desulfosporosinus lacus TaxID=329936 RepID=UPI00135640F2|nr:hydantoinase/oxoprolinase family protein [Desulfosporosinus lacus]